MDGAQECSDSARLYLFLYAGAFRYHLLALTSRADLLTNPLLLRHSLTSLLPRDDRLLSFVGGFRLGMWAFGRTTAALDSSFSEPQPAVVRDAHHRRPQFRPVPCARRWRWLHRDAMALFEGRIEPDGVRPGGLRFRGSQWHPSGRLVVLAYTSLSRWIVVAVDDMEAGTLPFYVPFAVLAAFPLLRPFLPASL